MGYITRLYNEYIDLDSKINKLKDFLKNNNDLEEFKTSLMRSRLNAMQQYKAILLERIKLEERNYEDVY